MTAEELVNDPYIKCEDIRLTVFEKAGTFQRTAAQDITSAPRRFKTSSQSFNGAWTTSQPQFNPKQINRETIKDAHISAVEHLVSLTLHN